VRKRTALRLDLGSLGVVLDFRVQVANSRVHLQFEAAVMRDALKMFFLLKMIRSYIRHVDG
jgi:hypothetical protein